MFGRDDWYQRGNKGHGMMGMMSGENWGRKEGLTRTARGSGKEEEEEVRAAGVRCVLQERSWKRGGGERGSGPLEQIQRGTRASSPAVHPMLNSLIGRSSQGPPWYTTGLGYRMPPCHRDSHLPPKPAEMSQLMHLAPQRRECSLHNSR